MEYLIADALEQPSRNWFAMGLGTAFVIAMGMITYFYVDSDKESGIDTGFLGLIFMLVIIFFLIAFSFLVAASVKGLDVKITVAAIDALVLLGSKLLTPTFLAYLSSEHESAGTKPSKFRSK